MPTYIERTRQASDDLKAISVFVHQEQKHWQTLRQQLRNLDVLFNNYLQAVEDPSQHQKLRRYDEKAAIAFYSLYDSKAKCLAYVDEFRREATEKLGACPYCGLPSNITLDHYLPRKLKAFPEFSVLSANLVPACTDCQGKKHDFFAIHKKNHRLTRGARFKSPSRFANVIEQHSRHATKHMLQIKRNSASSLRLLHPYVDAFMMHSVLSVHPARQSNTFDVQASGHLCRAKREHLNFHLEKLKVSARSSGTIGRCRNAIIRDLLSNKINFDRQSVQKELPRLLKSALERSSLAPNAIEPAYIISLMNHPSTLDELIDWSRQRIEPNVLAAKPVIL